MGARHAQILTETPGFELAAVCDTNAELGNKLAAERSVPLVDFDGLLADPNINGVVLTLPSQLHAEYGLRAIEAHKHIIMEKPLATKPEDGRKLVNAARHAGVILAVIAQNRFSDGALALKAALQTGALGKLILARATVKWYRNDEYYAGSDWRGRRDGEGGGVLMNQAIHSTDMLIHLLGRPQAVLALCARNRKVIDTEDTAVSILSFQRNILVTLEASTSTWPGFEEAYEFHGDAGHAQLQKGKLVQFATRSEQGPPEIPAQPAVTVTDPKLVLFQRQYHNIHEAMSGGPQKLLVTPEESLWVVETTRMMYESADQLSNETVSF